VVTDSGCLESLPAATVIISRTIDARYSVGDKAFCLKQRNLHRENLRHLVVQRQSERKLYVVSFE